jgi:DUF2075 family protein
MKILLIVLALICSGSYCFADSLVVCVKGTTSSYNEKFVQDKDGWYKNKTQSIFVSCKQNTLTKVCTIWSNKDNKIDSVWFLYGCLGLENFGVDVTKWTSTIYRTLVKAKTNPQNGYSFEIGGTKTILLPDPPELFIQIVG